MMSTKNPKSDYRLWASSRVIPSSRFLSSGSGYSAHESTNYLMYSTWVEVSNQQKISCQTQWFYPSRPRRDEVAIHLWWVLLVPHCILSLLALVSATHSGYVQCKYPCSESPRLCHDVWAQSKHLTRFWFTTRSQKDWYRLKSQAPAVQVVTPQQPPDKRDWRWPHLTRTKRKTYK